MKTGQNIEQALCALAQIQSSRNNVAVGGSVALFLHKHWLPRFLDKDYTFDLDIVCTDIEAQWPRAGDNTHPSADDMDVLTEVNGVAVDVRLCPYFNSVQIEYSGHVYNVLTLDEVLWWKRKYAAKKVQKHIDDLKFLNA